MYSINCGCWCIFILSLSCSCLSRRRRLKKKRLRADITEERKRPRLRLTIPGYGPYTPTFFTQGHNRRYITQPAQTLTQRNYASHNFRLLLPNQIVSITLFNNKLTRLTFDHIKSIGTNLNNQRQTLLRRTKHCKSIRAQFTADPKRFISNERSAITLTDLRRTASSLNLDFLFTLLLMLVVFFVTWLKRARF